MFVRDAFDNLFYNLGVLEHNVSAGWSTFRTLSTPDRILRRSCSPNTARYLRSTLLRTDSPGRHSWLGSRSGMVHGPRQRKPPLTGRSRRPAPLAAQRQTVSRRSASWAVIGQVRSSVTSVADLAALVEPSKEIRPRLSVVERDASLWRSLLRCPECGSFWIEEYPWSEHYGGGPAVASVQSSDAATYFRSTATLVAALRRQHDDDEFLDRLGAEVGPNVCKNRDAATFASRPGLPTSPLQDD